MCHWRQIVTDKSEIPLVPLFYLVLFGLNWR
jgi:hypothetical protein